MTRFKLWMVPAIFTTLLAAGAGAASAQVVVQSEDSYYDDDRGPAVVYRDDDDDAEPDFRMSTYDYSLRPSGPSGCGTYHFWNGDRCVDARYR